MLNNRDILCKCCYGTYFSFSSSTDRNRMYLHVHCVYFLHIPKDWCSQLFGILNFFRTCFILLEFSLSTEINAFSSEVCELNYCTSDKTFLHCDGWLPFSSTLLKLFCLFHFKLTLILSWRSQIYIQHWNCSVFLSDLSFYVFTNAI